MQKKSSTLVLHFINFRIFANAMENKKLISIRLDPDVVAKIDNMAESYRYRTRSSIINHLLSVVLKCSTGGTLDKMLSEFRPVERGFSCKFEQKKN